MTFCRPQASRFHLSSHKLLMTFVAASALCSAAACTPEPGKIVTHENACDPANNHQRISLSGFITTGQYIRCGDDCSFPLRKWRDAEDPNISATIMVGDGKNEVKELPDDFTESDIQFKTQSGSVVGNLAYVRVSGRALIGEGTCQIVQANLIEAMTPPSQDGAPKAKEPEEVIPQRTLDLREDLQKACKIAAEVKGDDSVSAEERPDVIIERWKNAETRVDFGMMEMDLIMAMSVDEKRQVFLKTAKKAGLPDLKCPGFLED